MKKPADTAPSLPDEESAEYTARVGRWEAEALAAIATYTFWADLHVLEMGLGPSSHALNSIMKMAKGHTGHVWRNNIKTKTSLRFELSRRGAWEFSRSEVRAVRGEKDFDILRLGVSCGRYRLWV